MAASACSSAYNVDSGVDFSRAWINCDAAIDAAYAEEVLGMYKW